MLRVLVHIINANNNNYRELAIKCFCTKKEFNVHLTLLSVSRQYASTSLNLGLCFVSTPIPTVHQYNHLRTVAYTDF